MLEKKRFVDFVEDAKCFDIRAQMRLILLAAGVKPATYAPLKITAKNLEDKHHFELHLAENDVLFRVSRPKSFEEIKAINKNTVEWVMTGTWYGYDLFADSKAKKLFEQYIRLIKAHKMKQADLVAGKLYGYPACCVKKFIKEQDLNYIANKYTYYAYFDKQAKLKRAFPYVSHTPCSLNCKQTKKLNLKNKDIIRRLTPKFFKAYERKRKFKMDLIIDTESDLYFNDKESVWLEKNGHQYQAIAKKKIDGKYYLFTVLSKNSLERGTLVNATVTIQHSFPDIKINKIIGFLHDIAHQRRFLIGR